MKISVIIPVFNVEKYLEKCLQSILCQDFSEYEILLVDDGSTDSSPAICDEYAQTYSQVQTIHQENRGQGGARNTGIKAATGEYLLFVDSDDSLKSGALGTLYEIAAAKEADVVAFGMDFVDEQGRVTATRTPTESGTVVVQDESLFLTFFKDSYVWNKLYRRSLFAENGIVFPERIWYEDMCVVAETALFVKKAVLTDRSLYCYLQRSDSTMHVKKTDKNRDMLTAMGHVLHFYKERDAFASHRDELCFLTVMHMMVLCTLRVAAENLRHPLLTEFYDFTKQNFPDFKNNKTVKQQLSTRHKIIFALSRRKCYRGLVWLNRLNSLR